MALEMLVGLAFVTGVFVFAAILKIVGISTFVVSIIVVRTTAASPRESLALLDWMHL